MTTEVSAETPIVDLLASMTADSLQATKLDPQTLMLVRFAALIAIDAPPASYLMNLGAASEAGLTAVDATNVLLAVAPIVGTPRTVASVGNIVRALGLAIDLAGLDAEPKS